MILQKMASLHDMVHGPEINIKS